MRKSSFTYNHWYFSVALAGFRGIAIALRVTAFVVAADAISGSGIRPAWTQQQTAPVKLPIVKQIALTEKQIQGMIAASKDIQKIFDYAAEDINKLKPETVALLDDVARKNGLSSYNEYDDVSNNVGLVLGGYDPVTRKYVGKDALIKLRIARVNADRKLSAEDRKEALQSLSDDRQLPLAPVENKNNIALVLKYIDKLSAALDGD
jgi:hypothetical protein